MNAIIHVQQRQPLDALDVVMYFAMNMHGLKTMPCVSHAEIYAHTAMKYLAKDVLFAINILTNLG